MAGQISETDILNFLSITKSTANSGTIGLCRKVAHLEASVNGICAFLVAGVAYSSRALAFASVIKNANSGMSGKLNILEGENIRLFYKDTSSGCDIYASFDFRYGNITILPLGDKSCTFSFGDLETIPSDVIEVTAN